MFDLSTVWLFMLFLGIFWLFWQSRRFAETARVAAVAYCKKHHLQLLSTAMANIKLGFHNGPQIVIIFELNYSADGLTAKQGEIEIINGRVNQISHWS